MKKIKDNKSNNINNIHICDNVHVDAISFSCACSNCGTQLNAKYKIQENSSPALALAVVCPKCQTRTTVRVDVPSYNKNTDIVNNGLKEKPVICAKCKSVLATNAKYCTNCGKHIKSKKKTFTYKWQTIFSLLIIFVLLATNIYTLYNYYIVSTELDKNFTEFNELNNMYLEQKSDYEVLEEQHRILTDENEELSQKYNSEVASNKSLSESYSNLKSDYDNLQVEQKETTKKYIDLQNDAKKCVVPSCDSDARSDSFYCFWHECSKVGCHEKRANDFCHYCINHKCFVPNCNWGQAYNSVYCSSHKQ